MCIDRRRRFDFDRWMCLPNWKVSGLRICFREVFLAQDFWPKCCKQLGLRKLSPISFTGACRDVFSLLGFFQYVGCTRIVSLLGNL